MFYSVFAELKVGHMRLEDRVAQLERCVPRGEGSPLAAVVLQCIIVDGELSALVVEVDFLFTRELAFRLQKGSLGHRQSFFLIE